MQIISSDIPITDGLRYQSSLCEHRRHQAKNELFQDNLIFTLSEMSITKSHKPQKLSCLDKLDN